MHPSEHRTLSVVPVLLLATVLACLPTEVSAITRSSPTLAPLWKKLDAAREYRCQIPIKIARGRCERNTFDQMVENYRKPVEGYQPRTPQQIFEQLAGPATPSTTDDPVFADYLDDPKIGEEAEAGVREALNELMVGQLQLGNDLLMKGLRTRFPGAGDPADPDQLTLLRSSVASFSQGIRLAVDRLRSEPESLRAGEAGKEFPFYVENARRAGEGTGEIVENEFYQFTELVRRGGIATNSMGKRIFFFGNETDAGRDDAVEAVKTSAQGMYLHTAILTSLQSSTDFNNNNGFELKRQVLDAQRLFDDIKSGFNPLKLSGDFVPHQPVESLLGVFDDLVSDAAAKEVAASEFEREYDTDQTALQNELLAQQQGNLNEISRLTGISIEDLQSNYDFLDIADRQKLIADAEQNRSQNRGELGLRSLAIEEALVDAKLAYEQVAQIPEQIRYEEESNRQIVNLTLETGNEIAALQHAEAMWGSFSVSGGISFGGNNGTSYSVGVSFNPFASLVGIKRGNQTILSAIQNATIANIQSAVRVKNLLLQQATAAIALERAGGAIQTRQAELEEARAALQRAIRNHETSRTNLTTAYFANPAYRLQLDLARQNADASFEAAMVQGYYATKALEYEWAERLQNPVEKLNGGLPETIGDAGAYDAIVKAESVFAVRSAGAPSAPAPSLVTYRQALRLWDSKMRQLRFPATQEGSIVNVSLRQQVLGLDRAEFADFIQKHRVPGQNGTKQDLVFDFAIDIADQLLLPALPNVKIESMRVNLKSVPGKSLRESGSFGNAALVNLIMVDTATVRTFFANWPADDDLLMVDLEEGRNFVDSPFFSQVNSSVDNFPAIQAPNTQLAGHSPAVTRWTVWLDMSTGENRYLNLANLDDIEIELTYRYGRPRAFTF